MAHRQEIIKLLGEAYEPFNRKKLSNAELKFIIDLYENQLLTLLRVGDLVHTSMGVFFAFTSKPKNVRLPRTGEIFTTPAKNRIRFRCNKIVEENVN